MTGNVSESSQDDDSFAFYRSLTPRSADYLSNTDVGDAAGAVKWQHEARDKPHRIEVRNCILKLLLRRMGEKRKPENVLRQIPQMTIELETSLYQNAPSFDDYMDMDTLKQRLQEPIQTSLKKREKQCRRNDRQRDSQQSCIEMRQDVGSSQSQSTGSPTAEAATDAIAQRTLRPDNIGSCGTIEAPTIAEPPECIIPYRLIRTEDIPSESKKRTRPSNLLLEGLAQVCSVEYDAAERTEERPTVKSEEKPVAPKVIQNCEVLPQDILIGRSPSQRKHPGNSELNQLLQERFDEYEEAGKMEKIKIASGIVEEIFRKGGRFLRENEATLGMTISWTPVGILQAHRRVASGFRGKRKRQKRAGDTITI
jgi:hypothetical protein